MGEQTYCSTQIPADAVLSILFHLSLDGSYQKTIKTLGYVVLKFTEQQR